MDDASQVLLRLADPQTRGDMLDSDALLAIAALCYEIDPALVTGPTSAVYDRVDVAVPIVPEMAVSARLMRAGDALPWDVTATWDPALAPVPGADAVIVGSVVVRVGAGTDAITRVTTSAPDLDAAFAAALAGLPPTASTDEIRAALRLAAEQALTSQPLTDTELDAILAGAGPAAAGASAGDPRRIGRVAGGRDALSLSLTMAAAADPAAAVPLALPVVVAFLVAEATTAPRELLQATALARRASRPYPVPPPPADAPPRRTDRCVCWLLPGAAFDDPGWPGGSGGSPEQARGGRLAAARAWLATQGIAVVTT